MVMLVAPSSLSAASAEQAVAPDPRTTARSGAGPPGSRAAVISRSASTMPATSVLKPASRAAPVPERWARTVLTAPTVLASGSTMSR